MTPLIPSSLEWSTIQGRRQIGGPIRLAGCRRLSDTTQISTRRSRPSRAVRRADQKVTEGRFRDTKYQRFLHRRTLPSEARARSVIAECASAVLIRGGAAAISRLSNVGGLLRYRDDNRHRFGLCLDGFPGVEQRRAGRAPSGRRRLVDFCEGRVIRTIPGRGSADARP